MTRPHNRECEHADPGSLCDCDCAGSRHAVARTLRNRPAAGRVSTRAAAHARSQGRAPHVGVSWEPDPGAEPLRRINGERIRSSAKPARLSPPLVDRARRVREALPKDRAGWNAAARSDPDPAEQARLQAQADAYSADAARLGSAAFARFREVQFALQAANKKLSQDDAEAQAEQHPDVLALYAQRDAANEARSALTLPMIRASGGKFPRDPGTGLIMPDAELDAHLDAVTDIGRLVLAEVAAQMTVDRRSAAARARLDRRKARNTRDWQIRDARADLEAGRPATLDGKPVDRKALFDARSAMMRDYADVDSFTYPRTDQTADKRLVARREQDLLLQAMASARNFGGPHHRTAVAGKADSFGDSGYGGEPARTDWQQRLHTAGQFFPTAWLNRSSASALTVVASDRAYYRNENTTLSMPAPHRDASDYDGAFADYTEEVNVHELGHRMEQMVPGLTHLEFALVRRRARRPDGTIQPVAPIPGYKDQTEVAQPDEWKNAYTGKTYEAGGAGDPATSSWEAFQVGLQDTLGRGSTVYGDDGELLQAFVIGAMLTLG